MPSRAVRRSLAFEGFATLGRLRGAGEDGHADRHRAEHAADGGQVLPREDLRGGHHAGLEAVVHGQQHRHEGHEGLAAADVALQQAVHLEARNGVLADLADHALLGSGEREGKLFAVEGVERLADLRKEKAVLPREACRAPRLDVELHAEQLVELEPVLGLAQQFLRLREVDVVVGFAQRQQAVAGAEGFGEGVFDAVADQRPELADDLVHALRPQLIR